MSLEAVALEMDLHESGGVGGPRSCIRLECFLDDLIGDAWRKDTEIREDPAHEIAHFMLAPRSRRFHHHFGLGGPGIGRGPKEQREEELASILGILLQRAHGLDWEWTYGFHSWDIGDAQDGPMQAMRKLLKWGLIDTDGIPVFCRPEILHYGQSNQSQDHSRAGA